MKSVTELRRDGSSHTTVYVNASFQQLTIQATDGQVTHQSTHTLYAEGAPVAIHVSVDVHRSPKNRRLLITAKTLDSTESTQTD
jgi:hypothetical protein